MSAFSLAMPQSDPRLPLSAPDPQPQRFIDKYRPSRLADVVGQGAVVFELAEFVANPYPSAWFLSGPTGTGKSSVARCVAAEIGAVEFGGLYTINSGTQDADCVLETLKDCTRAPMMVRGASGWRCIIVEECDHISPKAKQIWLSGLDDLPPKTVVIFTTNYPEKLDERFLTRGKHLQFESRADVIMQDVQTLCDHIADREGIPRVDCRNLPNIADKSGAISFRRVADAMQSATLKHRVMARLDSSPLATSPSPAPFVPPPVVPPPVIPAEVSPPVETSPVAEVAAPRRKRTGTGKRRMSALETAESALAAGNPSAESGPIRAIQEIANPDHVWIRAEGSGKRTWRLHTPSPAGFIPTDRTMDASDAIACVLSHASHKPIPVPPLSDSAEVAAVSPVRIHASRPDRRKRINALGSKLESRMQAIHERIKEYNGLVRSHVRAHLSVVHTSGGPEACGVIRRARAALDKLRPIRESLIFQFETFNGRLGKIGWNTWNGGERPSAIPVLMIPDWYVDPVDVPPPVAEVAEVAAPTVEIPAEIPVLSSIDDVRGIPSPHVAIVSVNARGETYGNYRCDGTAWERIPTFPGETCPRIAHDAMGFYLRRGDAIPVASWRIGTFPTTTEGRDVNPPVPPVSNPPARIRFDIEPITLDAMRNVVAVSLANPGHIRIRHGMQWILHVADAEGTYWRQSGDSVGIVSVSRGIRDGSMRPVPVPTVIGFRPNPSPLPPIDPSPSAEVASGSQSDYAIMSVTMWSATGPIVQHATDEFRDGIPCMLMTSAGRMSDSDRIASRERDRVWRRALSPLANRIRKPRPVPPPPSDPTPRGGPGIFEGIDRYPEWEITETIQANGERVLDAWTKPAPGDEFGSVRARSDGQTLGLFRTLHFTPSQREEIQRLPVGDRSKVEGQLVFNQWIRCYLVIEAYRPDARIGRRHNGSIILPSPTRTGPLPSEVNASWRTSAESARVTLDRDSSTIRIAFQDRPSKETRAELRNAGWRWNAEGQFWTHEYSELAEDFAARYL